VASTDTPSTGQTDTQAQYAALSPRGAGHRALNALSLVTIILGLLSFVLGMIDRNVSSAGAAIHVTATVTGLLAIVLGLYVQMISATRNERIIVVTGMIAGFVGACLGLAHGGFAG